MRAQTPMTELDLFRHPLREQVKLTHPLVRLTASPLYLQHTFDSSEEIDRLATGEESLLAGVHWRDLSAG
jgi:hypothetical protein